VSLRRGVTKPRLRTGVAFLGAVLQLTKRNDGHAEHVGAQLLKARTNGGRIVLGNVDADICVGQIANRHSE
jgi:hypothetical protein